MSEEEITALAREYAEETANRRKGSMATQEEAKEIIRFLLRRYELVEKGKVDSKYAELEARWRTSKGAGVYIELCKLELLESLFPDLGKEVEE